MFDIIQDTREQQTWHIKKRLIANGIKIKKQKLDFGDYSFFYKGLSFENKIVIERKYCLTELAGCIVGIKRKRLKAEIQRAVEARSIFILLIENGSIERIESHDYRNKVHPNAILGSLNSWKRKHGIYVVFRDSNDSANYICSVFIRYINELSCKN